MNKLGDIWNLNFAKSSSYLVSNSLRLSVTKAIETLPVRNLTGCQVVEVEEPVVGNLDDALNVGLRRVGVLEQDSSGQLRLQNRPWLWEERKTTLDQTGPGPGAL